MQRYFGELTVHGRQDNAGQTPPELLIPDLTELWSPRYPNWAYQDSGRTTPATANGDRVGSVTGHRNGIHLAQATAGARATLSTAGLRGYSCLQFDAVDDYLRSAISNSFKSSDGGWLVYAVMNTVSTAGRILAPTNSDTVGNDYDMQNGFNLGYLDTNPDLLRVEHLVPAPGVYVSNVPPANAYAVVVIDDSNGITTCYGGGGLTDETFTAGGGFLPDRLFVNAGVSGGITFFGGSTIQEIGVLARLPSAAEIAGVIAWAQMYWGTA